MLIAPTQHHLPRLMRPIRTVAIRLPSLAAAAALGLPLTLGLGQPPPAAADIPGTTPPQLIDIGPRTIASTDFVDEDAVVTIIADGYYPGEEVRLDVSSNPITVGDLHMSKHARADGTVSFSIGGVPGADPNLYAGDYRTEIRSIVGPALVGTFSVDPATTVDTGLDTGVNADITTDSLTIIDKGDRR